MIKTQKSWQGEIGAKAPCMDDEEEKESEVKSDREALQMAEKLLEYRQDLKGMRSFRWSCLNQQTCFS